MDSCLNLFLLSSTGQRNSSCLDPRDDKAAQVGSRPVYQSKASKVGAPHAYPFNAAE